MVELFIDGGSFMWPILVIFIIGLVFVLERLYHLFKGLSSNEKFGFITSCIYSPNFGCNIGLGYIDIKLINSKNIFNIFHDEEKREVEVVPLPFSSRLEKMK